MKFFSPKKERRKKISLNENNKMQCRVERKEIDDDDDDNGKIDFELAFLFFFQESSQRWM